MPVNNYSVGRDLSLNINTPQGQLRVAKIVSFSSRQDTTDIKVKGLDGIIEHLVIPDGWSGQMDVERKDATLDDYFAQLETNYYAGTNLAQVSITETIKESNGRTSQYRYEGVQLKLSSAGNWSTDQTVKQQLDWMAARRVKVL